MKPILYIANRGEIALRILRTAKRMGFRTAVGYANQDEDLPFVTEADERICLEGEDPSETYLHFEKVIGAARRAGAKYLHPGYGFLSENPKFVDAVNESGIKFVGPSSESMRLLGDKIGSRNFLKSIGVPLLPSYDGDDQSEAELLSSAKKLGFPLLIKPSAGGGGKGMLRVDREGEFLEKLQSSKRVARAAFGDERVFLERLVEKARHIEVQILADEHGNVFSLGERECSLQKRHQKVIEEAPAAFLSDRLRKDLWEFSQRIAAKARYASLGTVEWIWDGSDGIYFLEVNARLQVEHPVTELVWNSDLVELQLKVAQGESLSGMSFRPKGHAIEARICAEDPAREFLPTGGKIHRLKLPENIRVDFGFREKNSVPSHFDSMMGKIIAHGESRDEARKKLIAGLQELCVFGPQTNRAYLLQLLQAKEVIDGDLSTALVSRLPYAFSFSDGLALLKELKTEQGRSLSDEDEEDLDLFSPWGELKRAKKDRETFYFEDFEQSRYFHSVFADWSRPREVAGHRSTAGTHGADEGLEIRSPMPGRVIKLQRKVGDALKKGDVVLVLEAMKMEHQIKASRDCQVEEVFVSEGERVGMDAVLIRLEVPK